MITSVLKKIFTNRQLRAFVISVILFIIAFSLQTTSLFYSNMLFGASFIIGGYYKAKEGVLEFIENKVFNVDLLMVIAAIGSAIIGYWEEGAILIVIFSLSGALEEFVTAKSTAALESLLKLVPEKAHKVNGDAIEDVLVETLTIGDCVVVRPGERIPVDGVIVDGESSVDQSTITGESIPVFLQKNNEVFTGTLNLSQAIVVENTTPKEDTVVERVVKLIDEAKTKASKQEQFVSRFERIYVNIILISSVVIFLSLAFIFHLTVADAFYRTMVFLVVASPCAVVAATIPVTLSAISNGARHGILFKGGESVEKVGDINYLAFDKTGTITKGTPEVTDMYFQNERDDLKTILMTLESQSTHPLAKAITTKLENMGHTVQSISGVEDIPGFGVVAYVNSHEYKIGSGRFIGEQALEDSEVVSKVLQWKKDAKTLVYMSEDGDIVGLIALQDEIREDVPETIKRLKTLGITPMMLTGDNEKTAAYMTKQAGIELYHANCLPETKVEIIEQFKREGRYTAMVGDGMNDGPAIAVAEVGFSMGSGSDLASKTADAVLMKNDLSKIIYAYHLSGKHNRVIRQNLFFALLVITLLVLSNFIFKIELPFAVVFHEGSTILVILNGLRLLREIRIK